MKLEIGESLGYSFLRHVKQCWLVQTNWKAPDHWPVANFEELEQTFSAMREKFDQDRSVFKGTQSGRQFLKQAEIDVLGVGFNRDIYAIEIAFHENGLQYGSSSETQERVLKKMLHAKFLLDSYRLTDGEQHIYFASPKVHDAVSHRLQGVFGWLNQEYPQVDWQLLTNKEFKNNLLLPTLEKAGTTADTSELFMRSAKLLELGGLLEISDGSPNPHQETTSLQPPPESDSAQIQPLVRKLMQTLLDDFPALLTESDRSDLTDKDYCRQQLGLKIGSRALLRRQEEGSENSGRPKRHWKRVYAKHYFVTNDWWKEHHTHNAAALLQWLEKLIRRNADQPDAIAALASHHAAFQNYLNHPE